MLGLPESTEFNKRIPKQKFYDKLSAAPELRRAFAEQVAAVYWSNKIAAATANIPAGESVTELEVFELRLNQPSLNTAVLQFMDREIPYHILFVLSCGGKVQAWIGYKEGGAVRANTYYHTDWAAPETLRLRLRGLDLDAVYEDFVRQIAGGRLKSAADVLRDAPPTLKESVERDKARQQLQRRVAALEKKVRNEKQFNRQVELNAELKRLKKELSEI